MFGKKAKGTALISKQGNRAIIHNLAQVNGWQGAFKVIIKET